MNSVYYVQKLAFHPLLLHRLSLSRAHPSSRFLRVPLDLTSSGEGRLYGSLRLSPVCVSPPSCSVKVCSCMGAHVRTRARYDTRPCIRPVPLSQVKHSVRACRRCLPARRALQSSSSATSRCGCSFGICVPSAVPAAGQPAGPVLFSFSSPSTALPFGASACAECDVRV
jgi:hypothetical protein